jgi:hypothetical protein
MLIIIRTGKAFRRPKYRPQAKHDQWGVYDTKTGKTVLRDVTHKQASKYVQEREK